jgi:glycosyltransferase involved in cell wall biosynthesis
MRVAVLMPTFSEGDRLARTLAELARFSDGTELTVFVVDDGSPNPVDACALASASAPLEVVLARHRVNLGQGAAIETARRLALDPRFQTRPFDAFVTMDSDGQHRPEDVVAVARAVASGEADVALGDRFAGNSDVPASRRWLLRFARIFERVTTGLALSDAHNGLRAFGPRAIRELRLRQNRMAHATEITLRIARYRVVEVPVSVRYDDDVLRKGQRASGAVAIVVDLLHGFLFGGPR